MWSHGMRIHHDKSVVFLRSSRGFINKFVSLRYSSVLKTVRTFFSCLETTFNNVRKSDVEVALLNESNLRLTNLNKWRDDEISWKWKMKIVAKTNFYFVVVVLLWPRRSSAESTRREGKGRRPIGKDVSVVAWNDWIRCEFVWKKKFVRFSSAILLQRERSTVKLFGIRANWASTKKQIDRILRVLVEREKTWKLHRDRFDWFSLRIRRDFPWKTALFEKKFGRSIRSKKPWFESISDRISLRCFQSVD